MKRISLLLSLAIIFTFTSYTSFSYASDADSTIEYLDNGDYIETVIESEFTSPIITTDTNTITKCKTSYYKNSSGKTLWSVKVTGTFTYGSGSAKCKSSAVTTSAPASNWKISSKSASKSGASAIAKATANRYTDGIFAETKSITVKLTCSPTGKVR